VNNVVYGEWIDSIVNKYLIDKCCLEPLKSDLIGFVVHSHCSYFSPVSYPSKISAGLFINRIGNSSVDYCVGIFENNESLKASAVGGFTHVFVDRLTRRSHSINDQMKKEFLSILNKIA
jgi:acyl-CoA thioester hydrolase